MRNDRVQQCLSNALASVGRSDVEPANPPGARVARVRVAIQTAYAHDVVFGDRDEQGLSGRFKTIIA